MRLRKFKSETKGESGRWENVRWQSDKVREWESDKVIKWESGKVIKWVIMKTEIKRFSNSSN